MMLSLSCSASVDLSKRGLDANLSGRRLRRSVRFRRTQGARCWVSSTQNVDVRSSASDLGVVKTSSPVSVSSLIEVVSDDLKRPNKNLQSIIGEENPVLISAAEQIFGAGGKRLRPVLVFLVSRATAQIAGLSEITTQHQRLAEIIEMIHTASLIHDDVLDDSGMRRDTDANLSIL